MRFNTQKIIFRNHAKILRHFCCHNHANCHRFATVGIIEPIKLLPFFARLRARLLREIGERKPAAVLLVDFGGFNIGFATEIRKQYKDLPIIYFISPQVWGSRPWRIDVLARAITKMLVIFPFEEQLYRSRNVDARFVGHPLQNALAGTQLPDRQEFCREQGLNPDRPLVGIFPGSRRGEINDHLPIVLAAVDWLAAERPEVQFVLSRANPILAEAIDRLIDRSGHRRLVGPTMTLLPVGESRSLMANADLVWAKSGTTTLEAALLGKPMLIFYRATWLSYLIFLAFKRVKDVGWPNLLAGQRVVPELIQLDCRAELLVRYTRDWLDVPGARQASARRLTAVRSQLGEGDFADNAAAEIIAVLQGKTGDKPELRTLS